MLIAEALRAAQEKSIPEVSLAAASLHPSSMPGVVRLMSRWNASSGLRQFKSSFAPNWGRLYIAAPDRLSLVLCAADISANIIWPKSLNCGKEPPPPAPATVVSLN